MKFPSNILSKFLSKIDKKTTIGFMVIGALLLIILYMMYNNKNLEGLETEEKKIKVHLLTGINAIDSKKLKDLIKDETDEDNIKLFEAIQTYKSKNKDLKDTNKELKPSPPTSGNTESSSLSTTTGKTKPTS
jgi:hypothetical protein